MSETVATAAWFAGRDLALEKGLFTLKEWKARVHDSLSPIIASGALSKKKVNRCLEVIRRSTLRSVSMLSNRRHEMEKHFKKEFAKQISIEGDSHLLEYGLSSPPSPVIHDYDNLEDEEAGSNKRPNYRGRKRTVLWCFRNTVRSSKEVHLHQIQWIRKTAKHKDIELTPLEWSDFLGVPRYAFPPPGF